MLGYLPQECLATSYVFSSVEDDILIVKNDGSDYYVPAFGVETLGELCPGEAYSVFLSGADAVDFTYPAGNARYDDVVMEDYKLRSLRDDVLPTGESHLIIVEDIIGKVAEGDIIELMQTVSL